MFILPRDYCFPSMSWQTSAPQGGAGEGYVFLTRKTVGKL